MDPLLLMGAVRVALGQLSESTAVRLRVPARDQRLWEEAMALIPRLASRPQVIGDQQLELGECRMETELGMADLGLWPQLKEIERGFFDRLSSVAAPVSGSDAPSYKAPGSDASSSDAPSSEVSGSYVHGSDAADALEEVSL